MTKYYERRALLPSIHALSLHPMLPECDSALFSARTGYNDSEPQQLPTPTFNQSPSLSPLNFIAELDNTESRDSPASHAAEITREREPKTSKLSVALKAMNTLKNAGITITQLLDLVLADNNFLEYRHKLFTPQNGQLLKKVLVSILEDEKASSMMDSWMKTNSMKIVCEEIHREMEAAKPHLRMNTNEVNPEFISSWDIRSIMEPVVQKITPTLSAVLDAATESKYSRLRKKTRKSRNRIIVPPIFFIILHNAHLFSRVAIFSIPNVISCAHFPPAKFKSDLA